MRGWVRGAASSLAGLWLLALPSW